MGKYVGNIPELSFLYILFDRVQRFLSCNLEMKAIMEVCVGVCIYVEVNAFSSAEVYLIYFGLATPKALASG